MQDPSNAQKLRIVKPQEPPKSQQPPGSVEVGLGLGHEPASYRQNYDCSGSVKVVHAHDSKPLSVFLDLHVIVWLMTEEF